MTTVSLLSPRDEEGWNEFVFFHPSSTIYHTLEWREVARSLNHQPFYLVAKDNHGRIQGVFPLFYLCGLRGRRLVSLPLRDRGGPLYTSDEVAVSLLETTKEMAAEKKCGYVQIKTIDGLPEAVEEIGFVKTVHYLTAVVPLESDVEEIWRSLDYGSVRWAIKKAEKKGIRVRWGKDETDIRSFYRVFLRNRRKLGVPPYGFSLFERIWSSMGKAGKARFLLAVCEDVVIAGLVFFPFKDRVIEGYAASDERYLSFCANDLLLWKAIKWAAENGYRYFDFGASSPYQKGLRDFKAKWGGQELPLPFYYHGESSEAPSILDSNTPGYRVFRRVWSKMPASLARAIGPLIAKEMD